jgi:hypothetical protein
MRTSVKSFKGGGYERGWSRGMGRGRTNLDNSYGDTRKCYSCNRLSHESRDYWYKMET